ncbi:pyocin knob domain-containing protein [Yersinia enterocolitica]|uniref:pyocin knob domain-containing protein n=1 Tax=Yersinia enterocolitica TaxID=630 RepID=UPI0020C9B428|nr:pyocin knob domain-containing protein [Yersinia enterocolitica]
MAGSNVITGVGTLWANNVFGIAPGQTLSIPGAGQVLQYEILAVDSDTKIRIATNATTTINNSEYAIVTTVSNSMSDLARRTAVQLALYQKLLEDWQDITTGTGDVTIIAPDGSEVVIPSLAQLSQNISNKLTVQSAFLSTDLNLAVTSGIYHPTAAAANLPLPVLGVMEVYVRLGSTNLVQIYHVTANVAGSVNRHFVRIGTLSAGEWTFNAWAEQYTSLTKPALTDLSGTLPVTSGGTGANTLSGVQSALGIVADAFGASQVANTPWIPITLLNNWSVQDGNRSVFRKVSGMIYLSLSIKDGIFTDNTTVFNLPVGFRPKVSYIFPILGPFTVSGTLQYQPRILILPNGNANIFGLSGNYASDAYFSFPLE